MLCGSNADGDGVGEMELAVNNCFPNCAQSYDWAVAEVIVWNRALDLDEGISVQEYLRFRRFVPPTPAPQHTPEDDAHKRAEDPDPPWAAHTSLGAPGGGLYRHISGAVVTDAGVGASVCKATAHISGPRFGSSCARWRHTDRGPWCYIAWTEACQLAAVAESVSMM